MLALQLPVNRSHPQEVSRPDSVPTRLLLLHQILREHLFCWICRLQQWLPERSAINFTKGRKVPKGWVTTKDGQPSSDPLETFDKGGFLTSLGGTLEGSSYKGYGLAVMANILSACLSGSTLITSPMHMKQPFGQDIGHFFMAIDPGLFRDRDEFKVDVSSLCDSLRNTLPINADKPVMVAGDPEWHTAKERTKEGIPVSKGLLAKLRIIAEEHDVKWRLD